MRSSQIFPKYPRTSTLIGLALFVLTTFSTFACGVDDVRNLKAEELKKMIASDEKLLVVDTRTEGEYMKGHIPKAILISQEKVNIVDRFLPPDKDTTVVFYCRGSG